MRRGQPLVLARFEKSHGCRIPLSSFNRGDREKSRSPPLYIYMCVCACAYALVEVRANWPYFMSRGVIYASFAAFSPRGNEMVITTLRFGDEPRAAIITPLMWEIVGRRGRRSQPPSNVTRFNARFPFLSSFLLFNAKFRKGLKAWILFSSLKIYGEQLN